MKINFLFFVLPAFIISCNNNVSDDYGMYFSGKNRGSKDIKVAKLAIDSIIFSDMESSYEGTFHIKENKIIFFDKYFGYIFQFDKNGNLEDKYYGQGKGPLEINTGYLDAYLPLNNKEDLFVGSSLDFHIHNEKRKRKKTFILPWKYKEGEKSRRELRRSNNFTGDEVALYEPNFELLKIREDRNGDIYIPILSFTDLINPYKKNFYNKAHLLVKIKLSKKRIVNIFGRFSPEYKKYKSIPQHMFISFDINSNNNNMYIGQEIDSLIYIYNSKGKNIYSFGYSGKDMEKNYTEVSSFNTKEFQKAYLEDRPKKGYYSNIEYFEDFDLLFRSYKKGENSKYDGLQIYKGTLLVADVNVPKGFDWVKGYIPPYFYSNAITDDEEMTLKGYRFTLPDELLQ